MSDSHIGASRYSLPWFNDELKLAFEDLLEKAKDLDVDAILFCGDLFDSPVVNSADVVYVIRQLNRINIPFVSIVGNHDLQTSKPLDDSPVSIVNEACPNMSILHNANISLHMNGVNFIGISYIPPNRFQNISKDTSVLEPYYDYVDSTTINIALIHQDMSLLEYAKYIPNTLTLKDLEPFNFTFAGHYHMRVESDRYLYVGSTYPLSFKQAEELKGGYLVTIDNNGKVTYDFVEVTKTNHKLKDVTIDFDSFANDILDSLIDDGYDVIRLTFKLKESQVPIASKVAKELRLKYKHLEKLIVDFSIIDKETTVIDASNVEFKSTEDIIYTFLQTLESKYDDEQINKVKQLLNTMKNFQPTHRSESKKVEQATKLLNQLL